MTGITHHVIPDFYRSRERQARFEAKRHSDPPEQPIDPLNALIVAEECDALRAAMARLSRADQLLLKLCYSDRPGPREPRDQVGGLCTAHKLRRHFPGAAR